VALTGVSFIGDSLAGSHSVPGCMRIQISLFRALHAGAEKKVVPTMKEELGSYNN
jgi:hypothetical protein